MINSTFNKFETVFSNIQKNDCVLIRYSKEKNNQTIHKEIKITQVARKYFVEISEYNKTKKTKISFGESKITEKSLKEEHAYLATLFSILDQPAKPKISNWKKFQASTHKFKWLLRFFILNTWWIGGVVGKIIAYSANKGNPHYRTTSSRILARTLGPLIFPGGLKKPLVNNGKGRIVLDRVLHKQYKAMRNYSSKYISNGEEINFQRKQVPMTLRNEEIQLETIVASNNLVNANDNDHLHIIYFNGNSSSFYQDYRFVAEDLIHYATKGKAVTAVQFNYPGVLGNAEVTVAQEVVDSGIAQVQQLLDQGVPHDKIVLHGVSLGGSIASHVAAYFHKQKMASKSHQTQTLGGVYVSRTFASTAQVGLDFFDRALGDNLFSRIISSVCLPFIKLGTWGSGWDLDTGKAFYSLPKNRRNYAVVISSKKQRNHYRQQLKRSKWTKFCDFILRRKSSNPVDDAILRRGLHDCWERRKERFKMKFSCLSKKAKEAYSQENRSRKMIVFDFSNNNHEPTVDGHVKGAYCYKKPQGGWFNPKHNPADNKKVIGLLHRSTKPYEAAAFARKHILKMASLGRRN